MQRSSIQMIGSRKISLENRSIESGQSDTNQLLLKKKTTSFKIKVDPINGKPCNSDEEDKSEISPNSSRH